MDDLTPFQRETFLLQKQWRDNVAYVEGATTNFLFSPFIFGFFQHQVQVEIKGIKWNQEGVKSQK